MNKKIKSLRIYVLSEFNRDTQGLDVKDNVYENYKDPEDKAYEDFEILWEECREVDLKGDTVTYKSTDLTPEEAIKTLDYQFKSVSAIGMEVDITFYNGKELTGIDIETAKKEIEKEENYYHIKIEVKGSGTEYFDNKENAIKWMTRVYCYDCDVVSGEMLAATTITGCSVEDVMHIAKEFLMIVQ